jgi:IS4 transposase
MKAFKEALGIFSLALAIMIFLVGVVFMAANARSETAYVRPVHEWSPHVSRDTYKPPRHIKRIKREVRRAKRDRQRVRIWTPPARVVAKVHRIDRPEIDEVCRHPVRVVGDQYASDDGARKEADKAWSQTVRWQLGERWMDRDNAKGASYECGRSSVGSIVGQVFHRCRLSAMPCRPVPKEGE